MSLDLNKLENKLDEALTNETSETLSKFLNDKRMTNNKQQTAVDWLVEQFKEYDFADVKDTENYIIKMQSFVLTEKLEQAKEMHRQQAINLYYEYERYVMMNQSDEMITESVIMTFGQFYKQTYGGGE
jgi:uncharacterized coiled-coil protein SlyX